MKALYTAHAVAKGGREGHAETDDKKVSVDLSPPASGGPGTNPEQLFACGYAACFSGAAQYIARQKKIETGPIEVKADITLNQVEDGFKLGAVLDVSLSQMDKAAAHDLVKAAHEFCPYSRATRGNIEVRLKVNGEDVA